MNKIKISVIIPTFNRNNLLKKSLKSLSEQSLNRNEYEVIICDDGSYESAVTIVKEFENKLNIKYCYHSNKGYRVALARNEGIYLAKGEICAFIDCGMIVIPEFLENHLKLHKKNNNNVVIGEILGFDIDKSYEVELLSLLENLKISDAVKEIQSQEIFADKRIMTVSMLGNDMYKWPAPWVFFWGGNVSVSRKNILEIGCFDESYQTWGGEDTDLGIKLYKNNKNFIFSREALAIHIPHKPSESKDNNIGQRALQRKIDLHNKYALFGMKEWLTVESKNLNIYLNDKKIGDLK